MLISNDVINMEVLPQFDAKQSITYIKSCVQPKDTYNIIYLISVNQLHLYQAVSSYRSD